jgi:hypothetical protein
MKCRILNWSIRNGLSYRRVFDHLRHRDNKELLVDKHNLILQALVVIQLQTHPCSQIDGILALSILSERKKTKTKDVENPSISAANWSSRRFRVNFAQLNHMRMRKLQSRLVNDVVNMCFTSTEPAQWEETLQ